LSAILKELLIGATHTSYRESEIIIIIMERGIKDKIVFHYDGMSPYYRDLWGSHIHHGFWITGEESKEEAQKQLILELVKRVGGIKPQIRILDVGCGIGGTSIYLAQHFNVQVVGITISPVQVELATQYALTEQVSDRTAFTILDGEQISFENLKKAFSNKTSPPPFSVDSAFDVVWISEALSHFVDKPSFFKGAFSVLKPQGRLVIADWFKKENLDSYHFKRFITPIEEGMLLPRLDSPSDYCKMMTLAGFSVVSSDNVSDHVKKTWDITSAFLAKPSFWKLAWEQGGWEIIHFMKAFHSMREGFASGSFIYNLIIAEKNTNLQKSAL